jgi:hypothetical protein
LDTGAFGSRPAAQHPNWLCVMRRCYCGQGTGVEGEGLPAPRSVFALTCHSHPHPPPCNRPPPTPWLGSHSHRWASQLIAGIGGFRTWRDGEPPTEPRVQCSLAQACRPSSPWRNARPASPRLLVPPAYCAFATLIAGLLAMNNALLTPRRQGALEVVAFGLGAARNT